MFSLFIFHPFFQGVNWPHLPLCTDAHDSVCFCGSFDVSGMRTEGGAKIARFRAPSRSNCSAHSGVIVLWRGRCQHCLGARASSTAQQRVTSSAGTRDVMTAHVPLTSLLLASLLRYADSHYLLTGKCLHHCSIRYDTIRYEMRSKALLQSTQNVCRKNIFGDSHYRFLFKRHKRLKISVKYVKIYYIH